MSATAPAGPGPARPYEGDSTCTCLVVHAALHELGGARWMLGNHLVVGPGDGTFAANAHLRRGSLAVRPQDRARPTAAAGLPWRWTDIRQNAYLRRRLRRPGRGAGLPTGDARWAAGPLKRAQCPDRGPVADRLRSGSVASWALAGDKPTELTGASSVAATAPFWARPSSTSSTYITHPSTSGSGWPVRKGPAAVTARSSPGSCSPTRSTMSACTGWVSASMTSARGLVGSTKSAASGGRGDGATPCARTGPGTTKS